MKKLVFAMVISAVIIITNIAVLANVTYAWFTDKDSNMDNIIISGNLNVSLNGYDENGFEITEGAFITASNWQPTDKSVVFIEVKNNGSLDVKYDITFNLIENGLASAIWYNLSAPKASLAEVMNLNGVSETDNILTDATLEAAKLLTVNQGSAFYRLDYGMLSSAGNEYQNKSLNATINLIAYQTVEGAARA